MIRRLIILLLIVGCDIFESDEPNKGNCILSASITDSENNTGVRYMCYESYNTKAECKVKTVNLQFLDLYYSYFDYVNITCIDFCQGKENRIGSNMQPKMMCEEY